MSPVSNILGVDPPAEEVITASSAESEAPATSEPPAAPAPQMTQQELDDLREKAQNFEAIMGEPGLLALMREYVTKGEGTPSSEPEAPPDDLAAQVAALRKEFREQRDADARMSQVREATRQMNIVREKHPDFDDLRPQMREVAKMAPGITDPQVLYDLTKAYVARSQGAPQTPVNPPVQEAEGKSSTPVEPDTELAFQQKLDKLTRAAGPNAKSDVVFEACLEEAIQKSLGG